ncbi:NAD(P)H-dependent oxidoreductase [Pseudoalteromonas luteoviolacea]|uniref:flavodoxin family protein n=1 Tax=Pseudoalteromonas luteoviolacea TaxID=43657 RepID=UPI001B35F14D|nr:NAD(P)H-dependent oxidoreductase [Pseudoalteromonas luteoviolacea]MBQ4810889.1 NAD(P)H-dependent oxidoreductase [Pseudoalteromonas luteoviolacea]
MKTIIVYSSASKHGNTAQAVEELANEYDAQTLFLDDYLIHDYSYEHTNKDDDFRGLFREVLKFDHVIFASPVYWYAVTPRMKAFIDRITEFMDDVELQPELRGLRNKQFSILSTSIHKDAPSAFIDMLQKTFEYLGMTLKGAHHRQFQAQP